MSEFPAFFMEQAEAGIHIQFIYDPATNRVAFVNNAYQKVLGGSPAQVNEELPALLTRLHPDDWAYLSHYWKLWVRGLMPDEIEVRLQDGETVYQWFCLTPSFWLAPGDKALLGGTLRDITATKSYQDNADRFNARKNVTLEILSHDMSGAFIMIGQITQYLREEVAPPTGSRVLDMLRVLETTSRDNVQMIRDFVSIEFLASINTDMKRSRVDVGVVLREPLEDLRRSKGMMNQLFEYSLPSEALYALLDINKFVQVIANLVNNALKFTPDGKQVFVQVEPSFDSVRIRVIDEGIGIPSHLLPQLFDAFTPARRLGLRGEPTTGLGLALCKTIVEWHKGTISVSSIESKGSTFTVEIPQA